MLIDKTTSSPRAASLPCLPGLPLFGNVFSLRKNRLELLERINHDFGDIGAFHFVPRLVPVLNAPELVRQALVDQSASFEKTATVRALGAPILGKSIFLSEGEQHRRARKLLASHFQHNRVLHYADIMTDCVSRLQATWREGTTINLVDAMTRLTLWIISKVLFDADVSGEEREVGEILTYPFRHFADAVTNPLRLPQSWPTPQNRRARKAIEQVNTMIYHMIEERRQRKEDHGDFLSALLHTQDEEQVSLSNQQARNEVLSLCCRPRVHGHGAHLVLVSALGSILRSIHGCKQREIVCLLVTCQQW